jgi:hypothetical protein
MCGPLSTWWNVARRRLVARRGAVRGRDTVTRRDGVAGRRPVPRRGARPGRSTVIWLARVTGLAPVRRSAISRPGSLGGRRNIPRRNPVAAGSAVAGRWPLGGPRPIAGRGVARLICVARLTCMPRWSAITRPGTRSSPRNVADRSPRSVTVIRWADQGARRVDGTGCEHRLLGRLAGRPRLMPGSARAGRTRRGRTALRRPAASTGVGSLAPWPSPRRHSHSKIVSIPGGYSIPTAPKSRRAVIGSGRALPLNPPLHLRHHLGGD